MNIRVAAIALVTLSACGEQADTPPVADSPPAFDAFIEYRGQRFEMVVPGECGANPDGTYLTWAVTLDDAGETVPDAPHLYAMRTPRWSVIDFFYPPEDRIVRVFREGRERFAFEGGVLEFEGQLGAGLTEEVRVQIICSDQDAK